MHGKFCFSKRLGTIAGVVFLCILLLVGSMITLRSSQTYSTKAAPPSIIGGTDALSGEFPASAFIYAAKGFSSYNCSGTLIADRWILTAAHCLENTFGHQVSVGFTSRKLAMSNVQGAMATYKYTSYDPENNFYNDIGLIKLKKRLHNQVAKILPDDMETSYITTAKVPMQFFAVGFGDIGITPTPGTTPSVEERNFIGVTAPTLQKILLPLIQWDIPSRINEFIFGYENGAYNLHNTTSFGDSGGGIYTDDKKFLVGVMSKGGAGIVASPSNGTKIKPFKTWIDKIIRENDRVCIFRDYDISTLIKYVWASFIYDTDSCIINAKTKQITGYACTPPGSFDEEAFVVTDKRSKCFSQNLTDCMEYVRKNPQATCEYNFQTKQIVKYGEIIFDGPKQFICTCTSRYTYPILDNKF